MRRLYFKLFSISLIFLTCCNNSPEYGSLEVPTAPTDVKYDIFLLIGQSNMAGRGSMLSGDATRQLNNVWLLNDKDEPERARNPLNKYSTVRKALSQQQINPGMSFGETVAQATGRRVLLVVNALGGSAIEPWAKTADKINDTSSVGYGTLQLYSEAVRRAKEAMKYGELKAIVWHQGEANAGTTARMKGYMAKLSTLVSDLRSDLGMPDLPFVAGEIARLREPHNANFNPVIRTISSNIPNSAYISSEGASTIATDDPHFDRDGQILLGTRYAEKILELCYPGISMPD